ncbi:hypothetical protein A2U01_0071146, partial [Trifolium medium]|nr:hypothetical protein [Trifolium medium]
VGDGGQPPEHRHQQPCRPSKLYCNLPKNRLRCRVRWSSAVPAADGPTLTTRPRSTTDF